MIEAIIFIAILLLDQVSKTIVATFNTNISLIDGLLSFDYTKNYGAAFSFLGDKEWAQYFFIILTPIAIALFSYLFFKNRKGHKLLRFSLIMIISGALGNWIDRISFQYVRDFIFVEFFANFNVADMALVCGAILFAIYILFLDKDAIFTKKKKEDKTITKNDETISKKEE